MAEEHDDRDIKEKLSEPESESTLSQDDTKSAVDHPEAQGEVINLDTTDSSSVLEIGNTSEAKSEFSSCSASQNEVVELDTTDTSSVLEVENTSQDNSLEKDEPVANQEVTFADGTIILDTSGDVSSKEGEALSAEDNHDDNQGDLSEKDFISLDTVGNKDNSNLEASRKIDPGIPENPSDKDTVLPDTTGNDSTTEESKKEVQGIYPENPFDKDTISNDEAGSERLNGKSTTEESRKEVQGIYPENPFDKDTIPMDDIENDSLDDRSTTEESKKEIQGIYPENPFEKDSSSVDATKSDSIEGSSIADTHKKETMGIYPENPFDKDVPMIAAGNGSKDETSTPGTIEGEKIAVAEASSIKESFFLDFDGEGESKDTGRDDEVICIDGVSIDVDGDNSGMDDESKAAPYPVHEIPKYNTIVAGVLADIEYSMDTGKKIQSAKPKKCCFNCLGDHNIPDCPLPPDPIQIAANKKKHLSSRVSNVRYHEECENKYGHYRPGKISESLREALGIGLRQLPLYIYRMRVLGYPPGWLKEAEVRQAQMKLFDGAGKSVSHPEEEEGETEPTQFKYNPDKLVSYPGFNVEIPKNCYDEWRDLNFPPMQRHHKKSEFKRFMEMNRAETYKKRKLKDETLSSNGNTSKATTSMELDDSDMNVTPEIEFNPPLPEEEMPPLPPEDSPASPVPLEEGEVPEDDSEASITFLEAKRKVLLEQLQDSDSTSNKESPSNVKNRENTPQADSQENENDTESSTQQNEDSENSQSSGTAEAKKQKLKHHRSQSKGFKLGAAIPESITPFTCLPEAEKWTVDVTDHINFENLPDALGTWDKMKGLVKKVRRQMESLHAEDDD